MTAQEAPKRQLRWTILVSIAGTLMLLFACSTAAGSLFLDLAGSKAPAMLENIAKCSSGKTCFTAQISFETSDGKTIAYLPLTQNSTIYEIDRLNKLTNDTSASSNSMEVRYLESFPRIAKVHLSYFLEYWSVLVWLFWSAVVSFIGLALNRRKPIVLNLRKKE
ncbi:MAG TPA: hypothetical protein PKK96_06075 [Anaerolineales bacterium]|nr:hypothetical protein [Anaerolineales bacterium]HNQ96007.1 hypothetical protein [Anaerolineales bacterium]HNS60554.1 hypothetical protein [Anaerolineales bacterium]